MKRLFVVICFANFTANQNCCFLSAFLGSYLMDSHQISEMLTGFVFAFSSVFEFLASTFILNMILRTKKFRRKTLLVLGFCLQAVGASLLLLCQFIKDQKPVILTACYVSQILMGLVKIKIKLNNLPSPARSCQISQGLKGESFNPLLMPGLLVDIKKKKKNTS